ncbi:MAG TPA: hypothetical protein VFJ14_13170 [Nocardioidaceae bacterium]|nr:hypothetical protein [Nocardioidaceae bacterium]
MRLSGGVLSADVRRPAAWPRPRVSLPARTAQTASTGADRLRHDFGEVSVRDPGRRSPGRHPSISLQPAYSAAAADEGIEIDDELRILPTWTIAPAPAALQRQRAASVDACTVPATMRKVISGRFEGGKTLDDYFPDLAGTDTWGSNNTAGPFDNGVRAGSSVQLIGEYPSVCLSGGTPFALGQTVTIKRLRGDGRKIMDRGRPLEGQTLDDIRRSGRDASRAPFRQEFGFAVSMADPISGAPYSAFGRYEFSADLRTSLTGPGGGRSVDWGVTVESSGGAVTKNTVR